jgi:hypothetical protein
MFKHILRFLASLSILLIFICGIWQSFFHSSANSGFQKPRFHLTGIPPVTPGNSTASPGTTEAFQHPQSPDYDAWFFLTYQYYTGGDWEIFFSHGYTGPYTQLTNNGKSDIEPSLNYNANRIAFASDRESSLDIYTMNLDGSDVRRLTKMNSDEHSPRWSNDGGHLVFHQVRGDYSEIYTINPDGTGLLNLTNTSTVDEYYPDWSPDSKQILYSRNDGSGGKIWLMNADGSGAHPINGPFNYLGRAVFSLDASKIAFDADLDGDGWNELGVMNADGSGLHEFYDLNQSYQELWMSNWWSDNDSVMVTKVNYVLYGGELYLDAIYLQKISLNGIVTGSFVNDGLEASPYFQTNDHLKPEFLFYPLATFSHAGKQPSLCWRVADYGTALISSYKLDKRQLPDGEWVNFWDWSAGTCINIYEQANTTWAYRGQARDEAGNMSPYSTLEPFTTFYQPELSGIILDNRNYALPGVSPTLSPAALNPVTSGAEALFTVFLPGNGSYTFSSIPVPGYIPLLKQPLEINEDTHLDIATRPTDDLIINGGFENLIDLEGWTTHNITLPISRTAVTRQSGNSGAVLGKYQQFDPWLADPVPMPFYVGTPFLVSDPSGLLHLVYSEVIPYYSTLPPGGDWSTPEEIPVPSPTTNSLEFNDLVISTNGTLFAGLTYASYSGEEMRLSQKDVGSVWRTSPALSGSYPDLGVDSNGVLHVLYNEGTYVKYMNCSAIESCQTPVTLLSTSYGDHDLAIASDNRLHVVIADGQKILYKIRQLDGSWTDETLPDVGARYPKIAINKNDTVMVYGRNMSTYEAETTSQPSGGNWSPITHHPEFPDHGILFADANGTFHLIGGSSNYDHLYYKYQHPGMSWSDPQIVADHSSRSTITDDPAHHIHIIEDLDQTYLTNRPRANEETIWIEQTVTIPADMPEPTLNFSYLMRAPAPWNLSNFSVEVIPQTGNTALIFVSTQSPAWEFKWIDLNTWKGQTVTVRFKLNQVQDEPYVQLLLDDISLGSWRTPLITQVLPPKVPAGFPFNLEVHGKNFQEIPLVKIGDIPATNVEMISSELLVVSFDSTVPAGFNYLWVSNPGGPSAAYPLQVGEAIYLPMVNR